MDRRRTPSRSLPKFNETVELSMLLGVDPSTPTRCSAARRAPHGTGQTKRVLVIASGDKHRKPRKQADFVGGDDIVEGSRAGVDSSRHREQDMMRSVGKLGKFRSRGLIRTRRRHRHVRVCEGAR